MLCYKIRDFLQLEVFNPKLITDQYVCSNMYILVCLSLFHNNTVCILFKLDLNINIIFKLKDEEKNIPGSFRMIFCQFFLTSSGWLLRYSHTPWYLYSMAYLQTWLLCNISSFILRLNGTVLTRHHLGHTESACRMAVGSGETYIMWHSEEIIIQHGILITQWKQYRGIVK